MKNEFALTNVQYFIIFDELRMLNGDDDKLIVTTIAQNEACTFEHTRTPS